MTITISPTEQLALQSLAHHGSCPTWTIRVGEDNAGSGPVYRIQFTLPPTAGETIIINRASKPSIQATWETGDTMQIIAGKLIENFNSVNAAQIASGGVPWPNMFIWADGLNIWVRSDADPGLVFTGTLISNGRFVPRLMNDLLYLTSQATYIDTTRPILTPPVGTYIPCIAYLESKGQTLDISTMGTTTEEIELALYDSPTVREFLSFYSNMSGFHLRVCLHSVSETAPLENGLAITLGWFIVKEGPFLEGLENWYQPSLAGASNNGAFFESVLPERASGLLKFTLAEVHQSGFETSELPYAYRYRSGSARGDVATIVDDLLSGSSIGSSSVDPTFATSLDQFYGFSRRWISDPAQYRDFEVVRFQPDRYRPNGGSVNIKGATRRKILPLGVNRNNPWLAITKIGHPDGDSSEDTIAEELSRIQAMIPGALVNNGSSGMSFKRINFDDARLQNPTKTTDLGDAFCISGGLQVVPRARVSKLVFKFGEYNKTLFTPTSLKNAHPMYNQKGVMLGSAMTAMTAEFIDNTGSAPIDSFSQLPPSGGETVEFSSPWLDICSTYQRGTTWSIDPADYVTNTELPSASDTSIIISAPDRAGFDLNPSPVTLEYMVLTAFTTRKLTEHAFGGAMEYKNGRNLKHEIVYAYNSSAGAPYSGSVGADSGYVFQTRSYTIARARLGTYAQDWRSTADGYGGTYAGQSDQIGIVWAITTPYKIAQDVFSRQVGADVTVSGHLPLHYASIQLGDTVHFQNPNIDHLIRGANASNFVSKMVWLVTKRAVMRDRVEIELKLVSKGWRDYGVLLPQTAQPTIEVRIRNIAEHVSVNDGDRLGGDDANVI